MLTEKLRVHIVRIIIDLFWKVSALCMIPTGGLNPSCPWVSFRP